MKSNQSWAAAGRTLAVVAVALIVTLLLASSAWAAEYKVLHKFTSGEDGRRPFAGLILDAAGNLYGTTIIGGEHNAGAVFNLTPNQDGSWTERVLHSFRRQREGSLPYARLVLDEAGNLYGTTIGEGPYGWGTIFKLTPKPDGTWTVSVLHSFTGGADGGYPYAGLTLDAVGNLYGTTVFSGDLTCDAPYGCGVIFKLTRNPDGSWTEDVLYQFEGTDGAQPYAGLILDAEGNLYGTTNSGGAYGNGTVFKLAPQPDGSWTEQTIRSFGPQGGRNPEASLVFDTAGNLYGTTSGGGAYEVGTVFELTPNPDGSWKTSKLHSFHGTDGAYPQAGLIFDAAGSLYGTTHGDGVSNSGTVFKLAPQPDGHWMLTKLHVFKNQHSPYAGLVIDAAGNLYGTTQEGGIKNRGLVFEITP